MCVSDYVGEALILQGNNIIKGQVNQFHISFKNLECDEFKIL